tara:strand:+ start:6195 stop:6857 length:663 start_codon:yes stop_codon:yes gene_type:complete
MIFPLLLGITGVAILLSLSAWQVQRMTWKKAVIAEIEARITARPVDLPEQADPVADRYLPVSVAGRFTGENIDVLVSRKFIGPGFRVIAVLEADNGRRVLVDRGFIPEVARGLPLEATAVTVTGNLVWPDELDSFIPPPDEVRGIWFARDVPAMAAKLNAEALLIVARSETGDAIEPMPVDSSAIPNDHLNYAITWFLLASVWAGMTVLLLWRIRRKVEQ